MKFVIHNSTNEGVHVNCLRKQAERVKIYIFLYIWKKLRNKYVTKICLGGNKDSCAQVNNFFGRGGIFNATFNYISVISWRLVLVVEETGVPGENHRPVASHWQTLSHDVVSSTPRLSGSRTNNVSGDRHWLHR
jgi:hypothetical protein